MLEIDRALPPQMVKANEPFTLNSISLSMTSLEGDYPADNVVGVFPIEIEGQGSAEILFYRNTQIVTEVEDLTIPTGIDSLNLPVSVFISIGSLDQDELKRAKCIINYKNESFYHFPVCFDDVQLEKEGVADVWFDPFRLAFPSDPKILNEVRFTIDRGTETVSTIISSLDLEE